MLVQKLTISSSVNEIKFAGHTTFHSFHRIIINSWQIRTNDILTSLLSHIHSCKVHLCVLCPASFIVSYHPSFVFVRLFRARNTLFCFLFFSTGDIFSSILLRFFAEPLLAITIQSLSTMKQFFSPLILCCLRCMCVYAVWFCLNPV